MQAVTVTPEGVEGATNEGTASEWLTAIHSWLRQLPGTTLDGATRAPGPGWNYYQVRVQQADGSTVRLLLNAAVRLVAASADEGVPTLGPLTFIELKEPQPFADAGFTVASSAELNRDAAPEELAVLPAPQLADVRYHDAQSVGDVLFNRFD